MIRHKIVISEVTIEPENPAFTPVERPVFTQEFEDFGLRRIVRQLNAETRKRTGKKAEK